MALSGRELNDYIARELREIVPVKTGTLQRSIEARDDGVYAVDYYESAMSSKGNEGKEDIAITRAWEAFKKDFEEQFEL